MSAVKDNLLVGGHILAFAYKTFGVNANIYRTAKYLTLSLRILCLENYYS